MHKNNSYIVLSSLLAFLLAGCSSTAVDEAAYVEPEAFEYVLGAGDVIDIFVWRNEDISSAGIPVRPDGKISSPLVEDILVAGKTPMQVAREIEQRITKYIKDPYVTVTVRQFNGSLNSQIRVVGEAATPQVLQYRKNMTLLDVMIQVGGLTDFASGNRARVVRVVNDKQLEIDVNIDDLLKDGDVSENIKMMPGDILIIPEAWF